MRKIIVTEFITLDGVVEAPGGNETAHPHGGWQFKGNYNSPDSGKYKVDELASTKPGRLPTPSISCRNISYPGACKRWSGTTAISFAMLQKTLPR
jgi:hypothetical protein